MKRIYKYLLVIAAIAAYAPVSFADDRPKGVQLNKTVTKTNKQTDGKDIYTLTLESYVNGENTKTAPADVVLVLDVSGSMVDAFGNNTYTAINKKTLSWAELQNKRYYIRYNNQYYAIYRYRSSNTFYFCIWIGDTQYYLTSTGEPTSNYYNMATANNETNNILTNATIYQGSHQAQDAAGNTVTVGASRLDALQHAVGIFIDKMDQGSRVDANGDERDVPIQNQIAIVKFAGIRYDGWGEGTDAQRGVKNSVGNDIVPNTYNNYTQVRTNFLTVAPTKTSSNAESLKGDINSLFAGGATNTNDGLTKGRALFNGRPATNKKTLVLFTDGASNQASSALSTASAIKNAGITIYTVGVFDGNENDDFMKRIASGEDHYFKATSPESLNSGTVRCRR